MYKRGDKEYIIDMLIACQNILKYANGMEYKDFLKDTKTIDAVVRNIEILGEAAKKVSENFREKYDNIEWSLISKTRDKLIHFYFGVDVDVIWTIISNDIPQLKVNLEKIVNMENWET